MSCFPFLFGNKVSHRQTVEGVENVRIFTYKELQKATNYFSLTNKIGQGGFGSVYKGTLKDGTVVAVKVLSTESKQGASEFLNELTTISHVLHENLITVHGCCVENDHRMLVYPYLENGSLSQALLGAGFSSTHFDWNLRTKICLGIARGIAFLHDEVKPHIVHRDIKASNILLDRYLNPVISDFGLAKLLPPDVTHVSTRVAGTVGYLAPEYAVRGHLTRRADVYSFGVLLVEIITGRCNMNSMLPSQDRFLLERSADLLHGVLLLQTWLLYERNELLVIVDSALDGKFDADEASRLLKIGLLCTQDSPKARPTMSMVVKMLTGEIDVNAEKVTKPGLINDFMELKIKSLKNDEINSQRSTSSGGHSSFETSHASSSFTTIAERDNS